MSEKKLHGEGRRVVDAEALMPGDRLVCDGSTVTLVVLTARFATVTTTAGQRKVGRLRGFTCY